jgi:hypothetical protein
MSFKIKKVTPPVLCEGNYFFHFKNTVMTYIVKEGKELKIITVQVHQEAFFLADYADRILASGNSTMEALMKFGELPDEVKYPDQEESSQ